MKCTLNHKKTIDNLKEELNASPISPKISTVEEYKEHNNVLRNEIERMKLIAAKWDNIIYRYIGSRPSVITSYTKDVSTLPEINLPIKDIDIQFNTDVLLELDELRKELGIYDTKETIDSFYSSDRPKQLVEEELPKPETLKVSFEGLKEWTQDKRFQKLATEEKAKTIEQLFDSNPKLANNLENRLKEFLKSINVDTIVVNNLQKRLQEKGLNSDAVAVSDILHKAVFLDSNKYSTLDYAEEVATFAIEFMGASNHQEASPLIKKALENITTWEKYQYYYDLYKDDNIYKNNERKLKVEILSKLLAEKIVENKDKTKKTKQDKKLTALENIINNILALFDRLWKSDYYKAVDRFLKQRGIETKGINKIIIRPFDAVINEIVDDILFNNTSKIVNNSSRARKGETVVSLKEVLENNPTIKEIYHKLNSLGFMFTGSPALSQEGTIYRESNKKPHDLDWQVSKELENTWLDLIKSTFPEVTYKINPKTNKAQVFSKGDKITHTLMIKGMPVDFFININPPSARNNFGNMRWQDTMEAKLNMGRNKDIRDLIDFKTSFNDYFSNSNYVYYSLAKIKPGVQDIFNKNPKLANAVYAALGFNDVSNEKISDELKDILTPKEDVYNRELYFSGIFQTSDKYDNRVNKELEPFLLPLIKKYVKKLMVEADVHSYDIKNYNEKIDKANTIEDLPNIEYFNKWGITNAEKSWTNLYYNRQFIINIIYSNIENLPLDILFKDDIVKKNGKYYAKIKKFKPNKDTTGNYSNVSSWHKSWSYPSKYYDYTIRAKFKPQNVGFGKYDYYSGYDNDYYSEMYIPEYISNEEVEIDIYDTFSRNKKRLYNEGKINVWFDTAENIEDADNAIINDAYQKDSLFEEITKYFSLIKNNQITPQQKQQAQQLYSEYLDSLNKPNTNPILQGSQQEQIKKFIELQERLNNKEFTEAAKSVFESSPELQEAVYEALGFNNLKSKVTLSKKFADIYNIVFNGETIGTIDIPSNLEGDTISIGDVNIKPEFRGKGLGVETYKAAITFAEKPLESFMATDEANRVWNSLIKQGLAKKTDTGFVTITSKITNEQKQQSLDIYTNYVASIATGIIKNPSSGEYNYTSQVKDIVYRGKTDSQTNIKSKELGIFFTDDKSAANIYAVKYKGDEFDDSIIQGIVNKFGLNPTIEQIKSEIGFFEKMGATKEQIEKDAKEFQTYILNNKGISKQAILNIKNPKNLTVKDWFDNYENSSKLKENSDGILLKGGKQSNNRIYDAGENQIVVFEPEQIHILGSKQDIQGFKEFVSNSTDVSNVRLDDLSLPSIDISC